LSRVTSEGSRNNVSINRNWLLSVVSHFSLWALWKRSHFSQKLVIFVHFKGFNISQKPKSNPLSYFAQKISLNLAPNWYPIMFTCPFRSHSCSYISNINISVH
jgi:hypothetical protein